jgi:hypothetical protein
MLRAIFVLAYAMAANGLTRGAKGRAMDAGCMGG